MSVWECQTLSTRKWVTRSPTAPDAQLPPGSKAVAHPGRTQPQRAAVAVAQTGQPKTAWLRGAAVHADGALPAPAPDARALHAPHRTAHQSSLRGPPSAVTVAAPARSGPGFRSGTRVAGLCGSAPSGGSPRTPTRQAEPRGPSPPPRAAGPRPRGPEGAASPRGRRQDGWSGAAPPAPPV